MSKNISNKNDNTQTADEYVRFPLGATIEKDYGSAALPQCWFSWYSKNGGDNRF